jgi:hypothetical protein
LVDLEEEQSPWKDRVSRRWQRRCGTTDSSAEQRLEVGCTARFERAQSPASLRRRWRRFQSEPRPRLRRHRMNAFGPCVKHSTDGRTEEPPPPAGSIVCPAMAFRRRRMGLRFRASSFFGFGRSSRDVLGDVGVRFGGSEHHRIRISSCASAVQPAPFGVGEPAPSGAGALASSRTVAQPPRGMDVTKHWVGLLTLFGGRAHSRLLSASVGDGRFAFWLRLVGVLGGGRKQHEGNGRSDAVRLQTRGTLRRV